MDRDENRSRTYSRDNRDDQGFEPRRDYVPQLGSIRKIVAKWRGAVSLVVADNRGQDQIELRIFDKHINAWKKVLYFQKLSDFDEFLSAMTEGGDVMEQDGLMPEADDGRDDRDQGFAEAPAPVAAPAQA